MRPVTVSCRQLWQMVFQLAHTGSARSIRQPTISQFLFQSHNTVHWTIVSTCVVLHSHEHSFVNITPPSLPRPRVVLATTPPPLPLQVAMLGTLQLHLPLHLHLPPQVAMLGTLHLPLPLVVERMGAMAKQEGSETLVLFVGDSICTRQRESFPSRFRSTITQVLLDIYVECMLHSFHCCCILFWPGANRLAPYLSRDRRVSMGNRPHQG